jgi:hypothetical protein
MKNKTIYELLLFWYKSIYEFIIDGFDLNLCAILFLGGIKGIIYVIIYF